MTYYEKIIQKILLCIIVETYLNFTTDETFLIPKKRFQNLYLVVQEERAYDIYSKTMNNLNESLNRQRTANWTLKKIKKSDKSR